MGYSDFVLANGTWATNDWGYMPLILGLIIATIIIEFIVIYALVGKSKKEIQRIMGAVLLANLLSFIVGLIIIAAGGG